MFYQFTFFLFSFLILASNVWSQNHLLQLNNPSRLDLHLDVSGGDDIPTDYAIGILITESGVRSLSFQVHHPFWEMVPSIETDETIVESVSHTLQPGLITVKQSFKNTDIRNKEFIRFEFADTKRSFEDSLQLTLDY